MLFKIFCASALFILANGNYHGEHFQHSHPQPYNFGYALDDHHGSQFRKEHGNGQGQVQGSYGYTDPNGIHREVHYVADHNGFRAQVKTNEPGTSNNNPANIQYQSNVSLMVLLVSIVQASVIPEVYPAQPYSFGYKIVDKEGEQHRAESSDGAGSVKGNYGFIDNKGIQRQVNYVSDHAGFKAQVKTNEPGTAGQSPAAVDMISNDPYAHGAAVPYVSRVNDPYVPALYESDGKLGLLGGPAYPLNYGKVYSPVSVYPYAGALQYKPLGLNSLEGNKGVVNYGANLVGGVINGLDTRFTQL
ncbi:uncharacterized protein LOC129226359 [Uloborus diversus]|uniref:uncharacterized protein LOC129226359 n=1 Tax=Uloborus diversus TaxID=327109 RepID=UPI0024093C50|nr:uncharacterized protein LOC129226359 [Uloborus diversus]